MTEHLERLRRLARRLAEDDQDLRETLLDVSDEFLSLAAHPEGFPPAVRQEVALLAADVLRVQPRFRSHRQTSELFDREGLGLAGKRRAKDLAQRIIAVYRAVQRAAPGT